MDKTLLGCECDGPAVEVDSVLKNRDILAVCMCVWYVSMYASSATDQKSLRRYTVLSLLMDRCGTLDAPVFPPYPFCKQSFHHHLISYNTNNDNAAKSPNTPNAQIRRPPSNLRSNSKTESPRTTWLATRPSNSSEADTGRYGLGWVLLFPWRK